MQEYKFKSIDEFLGHLNETEIQIVDLLRQIIKDNIPNGKEKLSYNVPFYSRYKTICYIWPGSVLWGKKQTYSGVRLGFSNGYMMSDEENVLSKGNRKQVYWMHFNHASEVNPTLIQQYINEAVIIDEQFQFCG